MLNLLLKLLITTYSAQAYLVASLPVCPCAQPGLKENLSGTGTVYVEPLFCAPLFPNPSICVNPGILSLQSLCCHTLSSVCGTYMVVLELPVLSFHHSVFHLNWGLENNVTYGADLVP